MFEVRIILPDDVLRRTARDARERTQWLVQMILLAMREDAERFDEQDVRDFWRSVSLHEVDASGADQELEWRPPAGR